MGGACCVAARDKNIVSGAGSEILHRNIRYSPTWSFRWDNRVRVAGEETSVSWFQDGSCRNDESEIKSAYASEDGSPLQIFHRHVPHKSPISEGTATHVRTPTSDQSISRNVSMDTSVEQVKESTESPVLSDPLPTKLSLSLPSTSSLSTLPLSCQSHLLPASSNTRRWHHYSPGQLMEQASDPQIQGLKSSNSFPSWSNESTQGSHGGSSDNWSMHAFSELMATSYRERWSFDNESLNFNHEMTRSSGRTSASLSVDLQTCGICTKLLTEKSLWSSQKLVTSNELSVVAVLTCGHVYHAECLETLTPEIDKYDPACLICTLGEKKTFKLLQKVMKAEMDLKAKNKKSRNKVVDSDLDGDSVVFDHIKASGNEAKGHKMASSSCMKKPFLRRHFSFGSKGSRSLMENRMTKKKGFFWTRSVKV